MRQGSRGEAVSELQKKLSVVGFEPSAVDGIFGPKTEAAVRAYQGSRGLVVDGIVGPRTWGALNVDAGT